MVDVPQYEQQLRQRGQDIAKTEQDVKDYDPRVLQSQAQLRSATPTSQVGVRQIQAQRFAGKEQALKEVEAAKKEQAQLEAEFAPVKSQYESYQAQLQKAQEYEQGYSIGLKKNSLSQGLSKTARQGFEDARNKVRYGIERNKAVNEIKAKAEELGVKLDRFDVQKTVDAINAKLQGLSPPGSPSTSYQIPQAGGLPAKVTITTTGPQYLPPVIMKDSFAKPPQIDLSSTMPRLDNTNLRTTTQNPLSYLDKGLFTIPGRIEFTPSGDPRQFAAGTIITDKPPRITPDQVVTGQDILNAPRDIISEIGRIGGEGLARGIGGDFSLGGRPETRFAIPQKRTLTSDELGFTTPPSIPTNIDFGTGQGLVILPSVARGAAAGPFPFSTQKAQAPITPSTFGKIGTVGATVGSYFVPVLGTYLAATDVALGSKQLFVDKNPAQKLVLKDVIADAEKQAKDAGTSLTPIQRQLLAEEVEGINKQVDAANFQNRLQGGVRLGAGLAYFGTKIYQAEKASKIQEEVAKQKPQVEVLGSEQRNRLAGEIQRDLQGNPNVKFDTQQLSATRAYVAKVETARGPRFFEAVEFGKIKGVPGDELFGSRTLYIRELDSAGNVVSNSIGFSLEKAGGTSTDLFTKIIRQQKVNSLFDKALGKEPASETVSFLERVESTGTEAKQIGGIKFKVYKTTSDVRTASPLTKISGSEADDLIRDEGFRDVGELARRRVEPFSAGEFARAPETSTGKAVEFVAPKGGEKFFNTNAGVNTENAISTKTARVGSSRLTTTDSTDFLGKGLTQVNPTTINADVRSFGFGLGASQGVSPIVPTQGGAVSFGRATTSPGLFGSVGSKLSSFADLFKSTTATSIPGSTVQGAISTPAIAFQGPILGTAPDVVSSTLASQALGSFAKSVAIGIPASTVSPLFAVGVAPSLIQIPKVSQLQGLEFRSTQVPQQPLSPFQGTSSRSGSSQIQPPGVAEIPRLQQPQIPTFEIVTPTQSVTTTTFIPPGGPPGRRRLRSGLGPQGLPPRQRARPVKVITEVKRRGKFFPISGPVSPDEGIRLGVRATRTTIARTFRLKPIGVDISAVRLNQRPPADIFRSPIGKGKKTATALTFVEKKPFALKGSPGAVRDILQARRGGNRNPIRFI